MKARSNVLICEDYAKRKSECLSCEVDEAGTSELLYTLSPNVRQYNGDEVMQTKFEHLNLYWR